MTRRPARPCTECGEPQHLEKRSVSYPQSGLDNVQLENVPAWVCGNRHVEIAIPAMTQLHELLAQLVLRKPSTLGGPEIKFLRRRVGFSGKDFAQRIGITAVQLSRLENGSRAITRRTDLLIRLVVATYVAAREGRPLPKDLVHLIDQLEQSHEIGAHRLRHVDSVPPAREWQEAAS
jgi:transcriptional regulator with XRE-family HTH domain